LTSKTKILCEIHKVTLVSNKRRTEVSTSVPGISINYIDMEFDHDTVVNLHGYRALVAMEPQDADANCNGIIMVWVLPGGVIQNSDLPQTYGEVGDDDKYGSYLWGIMPFCASNQTPYHWVFEPKTSRNMPRGSRVVLQVNIQGVTAGMVRLNTVQTGFTSQVK